MWPRRVLAAAALVALAACAGPPEGVRLVDRGVSAYLAGKAEAAQRQLKAALELDPDNAYARLALGAIYERTGRADAARRLYAGLATERTAVALPLLAGVATTERAALARLARARIERLDGADRRARRDASVANGTLRAVFANLKRITDDLEAASHALRGEAARAAAAAPNGPIDLVSPGEGATTAGSADATATVAARPRDDTGGEVEDEAPAAGDVKLHLASYRTREKAREGWKELVAAHGDLIAGLRFDTARVDLGADMGVFYRVLAGPVASEAAGRKLCRAFKAREAFCALVFD